MATGGAADTVALNPLVDRKGGKSHVWKYFGFATDDQGNIIDQQKPICKRCHRSFLSKGGNTSNLIKHLKDRHPDLMKEFKQAEEDNETPQQTLKQTTVTDAFQRQQKYEKNSPEARRLNRAVAEFICMDQVPVYTVEKCGFQQMLHHFNPKYQLPKKPFYSCTTDLWTSRAADTFMSVTLQYISKSWELQSWCLGCCGLNTDHTTDLSSPDHKLIHDEPTRWNSSYDMVERFLEQQQVVCAVLAEDRKKWYLMPKDSDITVLETVNAVLEPLSTFTDALSGEKHTTLSSVLPLLWKICECLSHEQSDSALAQEMKEKITEYLQYRYDDLQLQLLLNTATYLDPRFKNSFVSLKDDVKQSLVDESGHQKKSKSDLKQLLSTIQGGKKEKGETTSSSQAHLSASDELNGEFLVHGQMPEVSAEDDPLSWWKTNMGTLPQLSEFTRKYLCIAASSCSSERMFRTAGYIVSPRRSRLTQEHVDMLVFLSQNLEMAKKSLTENCRGQQIYTVIQAVHSLLYVVAKCHFFSVVT
uniref:BED-type domain-containing protein n=1 Tax=Sinocyclocheilus grahami TaxID=75366 RepID=A0A672RIU4_SINGR